MKNFELIRTQAVLNKYTQMHLPQRIGYAIVKNLDIIENELKIYGKSLKNILDSYSDYFIYKEDGSVEMFPAGVPRVDDAHKQAYMDEINELLNMDTDAHLYLINDEVFDYDDSDKYDAISISDLMQLRDILSQSEIGGS